MTAAEVVAALELPRATRVDQRIAKKLLVENGAATSTDKKRINEGIEELTWVAAIKPHTIGVPPFRDDVREYLEVAVLTLEFRPDARRDRLVELVHRAIPYPVLLVSTQTGTAALSAAHKRHALNEAGKIVLDDVVTMADLPDGNLIADILRSLSVAARPRSDIWSLYQGWLECLEAIQASHITGRMTPARDAAAATARRQALTDYQRIVAEIAAIRAQADRESQLPRRVELNLELKRLDAALAAAQRQL